VALADEEDNSSEVVSGRFQTAPEGAAAFDFVFGGDIGGQGLCRGAEDGWTIFETIMDLGGDFFLLTGDSVYVDNACPTPDNEPGAVGPYTDLEGFRARYRYHLEDSVYADFLAQTAVYVTWDDHEIINDFGGPALNAIHPQLFADGQRAYFDYWPISGTEEDPLQLYRQFSYGDHADFFILDTRSYRDPNVNWDPNPTTLEPKTMLGEAQFSWLQTGLAESAATWKFIVSSVPLSYPTGFPQPQVDGRDSWANYSEKSGYETELAALLFYILNHDIENVVFISGDVHWPFAMSYDPDRDGEADFYEISAGPISAITRPPVDLPDPSFNPTVLFAAGEFNTDFFNFGQVVVDEEGQLVFQVLDQNGDSLYELTLEPILLEVEPEEEGG
jgi:alkaline phosphatase D